MRRNDREITSYEEKTAVMARCDVCRIALNDKDGYPYILPLNFGFEDRDGILTLYFHGAAEGTKIDLIRADARASFEMDTSHRLVSDTEKKMCTMEYESLIGRGKIAFLPEEEKKDVLIRITDRYHTEHFEFNDAVIPQTVVFALTVESMTGKRRMVKR